MIDAEDIISASIIPHLILDNISINQYIAFMKKFTLSSILLCNVLLVSAGNTPAIITVKPLPQVETEPMVTVAVKKDASQNLKAEKTINHRFQNDEIAPVVKKANTADAEAITPFYLYPQFTLFPITWINQNKEDGSVGTYYVDHNGDWFLPAGTDITFYNSSYYIGEDGKINIDESSSYEWYFATGAFNDNGYNVFKTSELDLTTGFASYRIENYSGFPVPQLTLGDKDFTIGTEGDNGLVPDYMLVGGSSAFNRGVQDYYEANAGWYNFSNRSRVVNYSHATEVLSYSNSIGAGYKADAFYSSSAKDVRNKVLANTLKNYGVSADAFLGYGEVFTTGPATNAILSSIGVSAVVTVNAGDEVDVFLYKITQEGEGENAVEKWETIWSGVHSFEKAINGGIEYVHIEFFDEETESEYITLEPNTTYMFAVTGVDNLPSFVPTADKFVYDSSLPPYNPDVYNRNNVYAIYTVNNQLAPVPVDINWTNSTDQTYTIYPSMGLEMDIKYPALTPVFKFINTTGGYNIDPTDNVVDAEFFEVEGNNMTLVVAHSDASKEELLKSIEYSTPELKDLIYVNITNGDNGTNAAGVVFYSSVRQIGILALGDIPADSWIKFNNFGTTLTINLPAHDMSGIGDVVADGEAVATEYFDLQGRKLAGEANGVVIKKMTMADGSVKAIKVVK